MKLKIYSVEDTLTAFLQPFYAENDEAAKRMFKNTINGEVPNIVKTNYKDMKLYRLGIFDDTIGCIEPDKDYLMNGIEAKEEGRQHVLFREQQTENNSDAGNE